MTKTKNNLGAYGIYLYVALFTGLIIIGSFIRVPLFVPITLQTLFIYIAGLSIGWYALLSVGAYLALGTAGLPIFAKGNAGIAYFIGPTGGFLIGFLIVIVIIAILRRSTQQILWNALVLVIATIALYIIGATWFAMATSHGFLKTMQFAVLPFLVGDALKIVVAVGVHRAIEPVITRQLNR